ncbi:MAG: hypothetical protein J7K73_01435 [Nanoarchaeota archaeon]|nr:hypothetical protein [Nanoarchaeota archaeon]
MEGIHLKKPVVYFIGIEFFDGSEHAKVATVPTKYRLTNEKVYSELRKQEVFFGVNYGGIIFTSFGSCLEYFNREKGRIEKALEDILGDVNVRVPTDIPEILKYTGLDGYLGGENLDGTVFDLPHEIDTNQSYYGGEFAGKNGPLVALPIVISYNNGKGKGEGVIGKIGLVKVVAIE